jgi:hypothetical protein
VLSDIRGRDCLPKGNFPEFHLNLLEFAIKNEQECCKVAQAELSQPNIAKYGFQSDHHTATRIHTWLNSVGYGGHRVQGLFLEMDFEF